MLTTRSWIMSRRSRFTALLATSTAGFALLGASCADAPTSPAPTEPPARLAKGGNGGGGGGSGGGGGGGGGGYTVLVLEPLSGDREARPAAINGNREVVGASFYYPKGSTWPTARRAFYWSDASGSLAVQPLPGAGSGSEAFALNSAGDVGGTDGAGRAVIWDRSGGTWTMRVMPNLPGSPGGVVIGLNDVDEAVGGSSPPGDGVATPIFWDASGAVHALPIPAPYETSEGASAEARAISASGHVVGWAGSFTLQAAPVFWARTGTGHEPILLSRLPGGLNAQAYGVAEGPDGAVRVAGLAGSESGLHAVRWTMAYKAASGRWEETGRDQLGAGEGWPNARGHGINAAGDVVGHSTLDETWGTPQGAAILWLASGSVESLPGIKSGRSVEDAVGVNDGLWAIGTSVANGIRKGVVWKPGA